MIAVCPRCHLRGRQETVVVPVLNVWFRCSACQWVWRRSLIGAVVSHAVETVTPRSRQQLPILQVESAPPPVFQVVTGGKTQSDLDALDPVTDVPDDAHRRAAQPDIEEFLNGFEWEPPPLDRARALIGDLQERPAEAENRNADPEIRALAEEMAGWDPFAAVEPLPLSDAAETMIATVEPAPVLDAAATIETFPDSEASLSDLRVSLHERVEQDALPVTPAQALKGMDDFYHGLVRLEEQIGRMDEFYVQLLAAGYGLKAARPNAPEELECATH